MIENSKLLEIQQTPEGWDNSASDYSDMLNETGFTRLFAIDCLDHVLPVSSIKNGLKILDIATGTGALSIPASQRLIEYSGQVTAINFSTKMIDILNNNISQINNNNNCKLPIDTRVMNAQFLNLESNHFDLVFCVFGVLFFPELEACLKEMHRVVKPGGKVVISSWTDQTSVALIYKEVVSKLYSDAGLPLPISSRPSSPVWDINQFELTLRETGFKNISFAPSHHTLRTTVDRYIKFNQSSPTTESIKSKLPNVLSERFDLVFNNIIRERSQNENLFLESSAYIGIGEK